MEEQDVLSLVETIRPEIPRLLGAQTAASTLADLDPLVERLRTGEPLGDEIFELLTGHDALRRRVDQLLAPELDAVKHIDVAGLTGSPAYTELPGHGEVVAAAVFVCPHGDYRFPVLEVGETVPDCPVHAVPLVPEPEPQC